MAGWSFLRFLLGGQLTFIALASFALYFGTTTITTYFTEE